MACKNICRLCNKLVISNSVTFNGTSLVINIPAGSYKDGCKYCIVVAQTIPATATINAPVVITIGDGTVEYPLTNRCCAQVTACAISSRTKYSVCIVTNATSGSFRLFSNLCCTNRDNLQAINGTAPVATPATPATPATAGETGGATTGGATV